MKLYLATASLADVQWAGDHGLAEGVVTTPGLLAEAGEDDAEVLVELARAVDAPIFAAVRAITPADIYRDGRELARLADNIVVQVPLIEDALSAIRKLHVDGARVAATLVFNGAQALLAAKAGATAVCVPVDQLEAFGQPASSALQEIREAFDRSGVECDLIASFPQTAVQFAACALAGADAVALSPAALRSFLLHPLTDRGVDRLLGELARRPRARPLP